MNRDNAVYVRDREPGRVCRTLNRHYTNRFAPFAKTSHNPPRSKGKASTGTTNKSEASTSSDHAGRNTRLSKKAHKRQQQKDDEDYMQAAIERRQRDEEQERQKEIDNSSYVSKVAEKFDQQIQTNCEKLRDQIRKASTAYLAAGARDCPNRASSKASKRFIQDLTESIDTA